jgi:hypothetical protein
MPSRDVDDHGLHVGRVRRARRVDRCTSPACSFRAAGDVVFGCSNDLEYFGVSDGFEMASARYTTVKLVVMMDRGDTDECVH